MILRLLKKGYTLLILLFLYAPILTLIVFSFNDSKSRAKWGGFTLKWYKNMLTDPVIARALYYTLLIAFIAAVISTILGTLAAIGIHFMSKIPKKVLLNITYLPVLNPDIVTGISLMLLFILIQLKLGFTSMLVAHITFCTPYVILSVLPKLRQLNQHTYEASLDLGASPFQALTKVIIPEISPSILTGFLLAFTLSLDDFVISYFTSGNGVSNLSITIFTMTKRGIKPEINALSTVLFVTILILMLLINRRSDKSKKILT
jgi:spermidine/putrescine transport system permease protein